MISAPTPPTDNFYKFIAICSVVVFVGSVGLAFFELKAIAVAGLAERQAVDEQTAKLEMWVIDADSAEARTLGKNMRPSGRQN